MVGAVGIVVEAGGVHVDVAFAHVVGVAQARVECLYVYLLEIQDIICIHCIVESLISGRPCPKPIYIYLCGQTFFCVV